MRSLFETLCTPGISEIQKMNQMQIIFGSHTIENIDEYDEVGNTLLIYAIERQYIQIIRCLLESGANPDCVSKNGLINPIILAINIKNLTICELLTERGVNVNVQPINETSPLFVACRDSQADIVDLLLDQGANYNVSYSLISGSIRTPFVMLAQNGLTKQLRSILKKNQIDRTRHSAAINVAAKNGHAEAVYLLIKEGWDVNGVSDDLLTPLADAVIAGHFLTAKILIEEGHANLEDDVMGFTPLLRAVYHQEHEIVNLLLDHKAKHDAVVKKTGANALHLAAKVGDVKLLEQFIALGCDINSKNNAGMSTLSIAVSFRHLQAVSFLLKQQRVDVESVSMLGNTACHYACENGDLDILNLLIDAEVNLNFANLKTGYTAMMLAASKKHLSIVDRLLTLKAQVNICNRDDVNALVLAALYGAAEIVLLLLKNNANNLENALLAACQNGHHTIALKLINYGAKLITTSPGRALPIHVAVDCDQGPVFDLLLAYGASPDRPYKQFPNALRFADAKGTGDKYSKKYLNKASEEMQEYLKGFIKQPSYVDQMGAFEESDIPDEFFDPITNQIMNIPVILGKYIFDLCTLLNCKAHPKNPEQYEDPMTRQPFSMKGLLPASELCQEMEKFMKSKQIDSVGKPSLFQPVTQPFYVVCDINETKMALLKEINAEIKSMPKDENRNDKQDDVIVYVESAALKKPIRDQLGIIRKKITITGKFKEERLDKLKNNFLITIETCTEKNTYLVTFPKKLESYVNEAVFGDIQSATQNTAFTK